MLAIVLNVLFSLFFVAVALILLCPQKITFHFDMTRLYIEYSCVVWKWQLSRETKTFRRKFFRFLRRLVPRELLSSLEIPKPTAKEVFDFSRHMVDDVVQTVAPQLFKGDSSEIDSNEEKKMEDKKKEDLQQLNREPRLEKIGSVTSTKEQLEGFSSFMHDHKAEFLSDDGEERNFSEAMENLLSFWNQEKKFILSLLVWVLKTIKRSAKLIMPTRVWIKVEGGVEDPKETADLWIYSRIIGNTFKQILPSFDFVFTPQFTLEKRWRASGEVVLEFNFLRILGDIIIILLTFPFLSVFKFYLRWRKKKIPKTGALRA